MQKLIRVFDNIGFNFIIENNLIKPLTTIKSYNALNSNHVGYYIPYIARNLNNQLFESGVGEIIFDNIGNIAVKRIDIIASSNNNLAVNFPSSGNSFYIFANQSSFDKGINNTVVIDRDLKLDPVSALYLVDCSAQNLNLYLPELSVSKNLILEFKLIQTQNHLTIKSNDQSVVCVLGDSNSYARIASSSDGWILLSNTQENSGRIQSLYSEDSDNNFSILSSPVGSEYSLQYKLGADFAGSEAYWDSTNSSLLLGADSETQANSIISSSGNKNTILNKKTYGSDFIVYGSGTINKNIFFSYDGKLGINIPSGSRPSTLFHVVNDICQSCSETVRIENRSSSYPTNLTLYYKPSSNITNNSVIGQIQLSAKNSVGNQKNYGRIEARAVDTTAGVEKGGIDLVLISGTNSSVKTLETNISSTYVGYSGNQLNIQNNGNISLINGTNGISIGNQGINLSASIINSTGTAFISAISSPNITSSNIFINNLSSSGLLMMANGKIVNSPITLNSLGSFDLPIPPNKLLSTTSNGSITGVYTLDDYFLTEQDIRWSKFSPRSASVCLRQITFTSAVPLEEFSAGDQIVINSNGTNLYRNIISLELNGNQIVGLLVDQNVTQIGTSVVSLYSITKGGYLTIAKNIDNGVVADSTENVLSIRPSVDTVFNKKQKDINFIVYGIDQNPAILVKANTGRIPKASGIYSAFATSKNDMFPIIVTSGGSGISNYYSSANYNYDISTNLFSGILSDVGTNGMPSHYGTYDQNGNAAEWVEKPNVIDSRDPNEFVAGGSYLTNYETDIGASGLKSLEPLPRVSGYDYVGFRIAGLQGLTDSGAIVHNTGLNISFITVADPQNSKESNIYVKNPVGSPTTYSTQIFTNLGVVDKFYRLGKYEVTNDQYCKFLNAVATSKTTDRNLYDTRMSSSNLGGIERVDTGIYEYIVKPFMGSKPVVFVSYINAIKFINWIHHGANPVINELTVDFILNNGSYNIQYIGNNSYNISKSSYRKYWLPDLNEWHKAAYYRPIAINEITGTSNVSIKRSEPYLVGSGINNTTKEPTTVFANLSVSGWLYADHIWIGDGTIRSSLSELNFVQGGDSGGTTGGDTGGTTQTTTITPPNTTLIPQWDSSNTKSILGTLVSCLDCSFNGKPLRLGEDVIATCTDEELVTADNVPWWCDINNTGPGWFK